MAIAATLPCLACNDSIAGSDTARGDYTLVSVDTAQLPAVVSDDGDTTVEVTSGSAQLRADGSCAVRRELRTTTASGTTTSTDAHTCTWTRAGTAVFLTLGSGGVYPGTWDEVAVTLELLIEGGSYLFAR
jgi:hypothetical protein